jgi:CheY-like chemotaxis protein
MVLKRAGFVVVDAASADQALSVWAQAPRPFDVLVTDYNMPGRNGVELAELLHARKPDLGVVLISGMSSEDLDLPFGISFLQKPFHPSELLESIRLSIQLGVSSICRRC